MPSGGVHYRALGVDNIAVKLVPRGCFVDVKLLFDRDGLRAAELGVWRL